MWDQETKTDPGSSREREGELMRGGKTEKEKYETVDTVHEHL